MGKGLGAEHTDGSGLRPSRCLHADVLDKPHIVQHALREHERQLLPGFHLWGGLPVASRGYCAEEEGDLGSTFSQSVVQPGLLQGDAQVGFGLNLAYCDL